MSPDQVNLHFPGDDTVGSVKIEENVSREMVADIMDAAGYGCNYWATKWNSDYDGFPSEGLSFGYDIAIYDAEEDSTYTLTLEKFVKGLEKACSHRGLTLQAFYDQHDAGDADIAVQFALFDSIVYG